MYFLNPAVFRGMRVAGVGGWGCGWPRWGSFAMIDTTVQGLHKLPNQLELIFDDLEFLIYDSDNLHGQLRFRIFWKLNLNFLQEFSTTLAIQTAKLWFYPVWYCTLFSSLRFTINVILLSNVFYACQFAMTIRCYLYICRPT